MILLLEYCAPTSSSLYTSFISYFSFSLIYHFVLCILFPSFPTFCTFLFFFFSPPSCFKFLFCTFVSSKYPSFFSLCVVIFFSFTSSRSFRLLRYFRVSSIHQIPLLVSTCACLRGRASIRASGNILFTPLCLSSLNSAARLSARFLFLFSL